VIGVLQEDLRLGRNAFELTARDYFLLGTLAEAANGIDHLPYAVPMHKPRGWGRKAIWSVPPPMLPMATRLFATGSPQRAEPRGKLTASPTIRRLKRGPNSAGSSRGPGGPGREHADHLLEQRHCPYRDAISQKRLDGTVLVVGSRRAYNQASPV
jgi:hypothetical protein